MGSFDVGCQVSRLTIHPGDKAVLLPLTYTWPGKLFENRVRSHSVVTNDGPMAFCYPFTLPIKGIYADYGEIEPEEESLELFIESTSLTPCYFNEVLRGDRKRTNSWPDVCATWIHGDIWDTIIASRPFEVASHGRLDTYTLECLGFKFAKEVKIERYNKLYTHQSSGTLGLLSDGTWSHPANLSPLLERKERPYSPAKLAKFWHEITKHNLLVPDIPLAQHKVEGFIKHGHSQVPLLASFGLDNFAWELGIRPFAVSWNLLSSLANKLESIKTELTELATVMRYLAHVNVLLMPSYCGPQHGDDDLSLALAKMVHDIATKAHEEYHSWYDGDN